VTIKSLLFCLFLYVCLAWVGAAYLYSGSSADIRLEVRLETLTRAKVEELALMFNSSRALVLRQVMRWGVRRGYAAHVDDAPLCLIRHLGIIGGDAGAKR